MKKLLTTITLSLSLLLTPILTTPTLASEVISPQSQQSILSTKTIKPTKVTLNCKTTTLNTGSTATLTPIISPSTVTNKSVTWKSSNTKIATVDSSGLITGIKAGKANITVTTIDGKKKATCKVTIKTAPIVKVTGISLDKSSMTINVGDTETLIPTITPDNATSQNITWESSNNKVVKVDSNGKIQGLKAGNATIAAISKDGSKKARCSVTVRDIQIPTIVSIVDITQTITQGDNYTLPSMVEAIMSDETKKQVAITWSSLIVDTNKTGTYIFYGTVQGWNKDVKLTLIVTSKVQTIEDVQQLIVGNWVTSNYKIGLEFSNNGSLIQSYYYTNSWYTKDEIEYSIISPTEMKFKYIRWYDSMFDRWFISKDDDKIFNFTINDKELTILNWSQYGGATFKKW